MKIKVKQIKLNYIAIQLPKWIGEDVVWSVIASWAGDWDNPCAPNMLLYRKSLLQNHLYELLHIIIFIIFS